MSVREEGGVRTGLKDATTDLEAWARQYQREIAAGCLGAIVLMMLPWDVGELPWAAKLVLGFAAGFLALALVRWLRSSAEPFGVERLSLSVPLFGSVDLAVSDPQRQRAWLLFVELATRATTQTLRAPTDVSEAPGEASGDLRSALSSLYEAFRICRDELKAAKPSAGRHEKAGTVSLESYVLAILNDGLRPFLARWHPRLEEWSETGLPAEDWPLADYCRHDLEVTRLKVLAYTHGLGRIAGVRNLEQILPPRGEGPAGALTRLDAIAERERSMQPALPQATGRAYRSLAFELATNLPRLPDRADTGQLAETIKALEQTRTTLGGRLVELPPFPGPPPGPDAVALALCIDVLAPVLARWSDRAAIWEADGKTEPDRHDMVQLCRDDLETALAHANAALATIMATVLPFEAGLQRGNSEESSLTSLTSTAGHLNLRTGFGRRVAEMIGKLLGYAQIVS